MVTYRTVVAAHDAHMHLELWAQAGIAPGCASGYSVRADSELTLAQPPDPNRLRCKRDQKRLEEPKGSWRLGLLAEGLARPVEVSRSNWLLADDLRLVDGSRNAGGRRVRPGAPARTRYGFRRAGPPDVSDIPAATIGALSHDGTQLRHQSDTTSAPQALQGCSLKKPITHRAEHGGDPGRHRRVANRVLGSAISTVSVFVSVSAANVAAISPKYSSEHVARSFEQKICTRATEKLRLMQNQRENLSA